ncbi:MAG: hypothetical protein HGA97_02710 [Chlorobiaceae bacterium]|jgi:hypothetical protein|nr:hypothetical protein [Chlorobiaceae bacterium]
MQNYNYYGNIEQHELMSLPNRRHEAADGMREAEKNVSWQKVMSSSQAITDKQTLQGN